LVDPFRSRVAAINGADSRLETTAISEFNPSHRYSRAVTDHW
jgi:hypothetical protein